MALQYWTSTAGLTADRLDPAFFDTWPNPPSQEKHLRILQGSDHVVIAYDATADKIIGYITAISDGVSAAYIPHLGVLAPYRKQGIGRELVKRMLAQLRDIYMIDVTCDADVVPFYEKCGFRPYTAMIIRNYQHT